MLVLSELIWLASESSLQRIKQPLEYFSLAPSSFRHTKLQYGNLLFRVLYEIKYVRLHLKRNGKQRTL